MGENRKTTHSVINLSCHIVWVTKYRYAVLTGDVQRRCRDLLVQVCDSEDVRILKGVVSKDHIHIHVEYPPSLSVSDFVKRLKNRTFWMFQKEFPMLRKCCWSRYFLPVVFGV